MEHSPLLRRDRPGSGGEQGHAAAACRCAPRPACSPSDGAPPTRRRARSAARRRRAAPAGASAGSALPALGAAGRVEPHWWEPCMCQVKQRLPGAALALPASVQGRAEAACASWWAPRCLPTWPVALLHAGSAAEEAWYQAARSDCLHGGGRGAAAVQRRTHHRLVSASGMGCRRPALMAGPSHASPSTTASALAALFRFLRAAHLAASASLRSCDLSSAKMHKRPHYVKNRRLNSV